MLRWGYWSFNLFFNLNLIFKIYLEVNFSLFFNLICHVHQLLKKKAIERWSCVIIHITQIRKFRCCYLDTHLVAVFFALPCSHLKFARQEAVAIPDAPSSPKLSFIRNQVNCTRVSFSFFVFLVKFKHWNAQKLCYKQENSLLWTKSESASWRRRSEMLKMKNTKSKILMSFAAAN